MIKEIVDGIFDKVTGFFKPLTDMVVNGFNYVTNLVSNVTSSIYNFVSNLNPVNLIAEVMMTGMMKFGEMTAFMMKMMGRPTKWKSAKVDESKKIDDRLAKLDSNEINLKNQKAKDEKSTISNKKDDKKLKIDDKSKSNHDDKLDSLNDERDRLKLQKSAIKSELDGEPDMGKTMGEVASFGKVMFDAIGNYIKPIFTKFTDWIGGLFGKSETGQAVGGAVGGAINKVGTTAGKVVGKVGEKTVDVVTSPVSAISEGLGEAGKNFVKNSKEALTSTEASLGAKAGAKVISAGYDAYNTPINQEDVNKIIPVGTYNPQDSVMAKGFINKVKPINDNFNNYMDSKFKSSPESQQQASNTGNKVNIVVNQGDTSVVNAIQPGKNPSSRKQ